MRARRLHLLAVALAVALALAPAASSPAQAKPPGKGAKVAAVSAGLPYVAPWESGFRRYSTQLLTPSSPFFNQLLLAVPEGQFWRIVYLSFALSTSAVAGNRYMFLYIDDATGAQVFQAGMPANPVASGSYLYLIGPRLTTFANVADILAGQIQLGIPDVLWKPGSRLRVQFNNGQAGDGFATIPRIFAIEVYTPEREGSNVLVPTPVHP